MTEEERSGGPAIKGRDTSDRTALRHVADNEARGIALWQERSSCLEIDEKPPALAISCSLPEVRIAPGRTLGEGSGHFLPSLGSHLPTGAPLYLYGDGRGVTHHTGFRLQPPSSHQRRLTSPPKSEDLSAAESLTSVSQFPISSSQLSYALPPSSHVESVPADDHEDDPSGEQSPTPPPNAECVVCGDKSSGKHYGQFTCEGCKSFFKRSVRRNLSYTCRGSRQCPVDMQHRNQCQFCRFQKCLKLGMRREAVQKGRVTASNMLVYPQHLSCSLGPWHVPDSGARPLPMVSNFCLNNFVTSLVKADSYNTSRFSVSAEGEHFGHLLIGIVEWAKKIPHFPDMTLGDQVALLKNSWQELFLITASQVGLPMPVGQMVSACLPPDSDRNIVMAQLSDLNRVLQHQLEKLQKLLLDAAEYACLKALVLFNPDAVGLNNATFVDNVQERVQCALLEYAHAHHSNQPPRFGRLLLRLPTLRKTSSQLIDHLCSMRLLSRPSVETLIHSFLQQPDAPVAAIVATSAALASPCTAASASGGHAPPAVAMTAHHAHPGSMWLTSLDAMGQSGPVAGQGITSSGIASHHPNL